MKLVESNNKKFYLPYYFLREMQQTWNKTIEDLEKKLITNKGR